MTATLSAACYAFSIVMLALAASLIADAKRENQAINDRAHSPDGDAGMDFDTHYGSGE